MRFHSLLALALAAQSAPVVVQAQDRGSAKSFVEALYQRYDQGEPGYLGRNAKLIFDEELVRLIRLDQSRTQTGYAGALDWDPICACQDPDSLKLLSVDVERAGASSAHAIARLRIGRDELRTIGFDLTFSSDGWRIADVHDREDSSLVAQLRHKRR